MQMISQSSSWGSYRPEIYFGMKSKSSMPTTAATGLMWFSCEPDGSPTSARHTTRQGELQSFNWLAHNGRDYGVENIFDKVAGIEINATFLVDPTIKDFELQNPNWIQTFSLKKLDEKRVSKASSSLIVYFGFVHQLVSHSTDYERNGFTDIRISSPRNGMLSIFGHSESSGWFTLDIRLRDELAASSLFSLARKRKPVAEVSYVALRDVDVINGSERIESGVNQRFYDPSIFSKDGHFVKTAEQNASFVAINVKSSGSFVLDLLFYDHLAVSSFSELESLLSTKELSRHWSNLAIDSVAIIRRDNFISKFEEVFQLRSRKSDPFDAADSDVSIKALSSLLGGIGFFCGQPMIENGFDVDAAGKVSEMSSAGIPKSSFLGKYMRTQKTNADARDRYAPASPPQHPAPLSPVGPTISLLSATPSRTAFPRGFLWDEGFHQLLVSQWDHKLSMEVLESWLSSQFGKDSGAEGWIPREMILGGEARKRVPEEFVTQRTNVANPPSLFLVVESLLNRIDDSLSPQCQALTGEKDNNTQCSKPEGKARLFESSEINEVVTFLDRIFGLLNKWLMWFLRSQEGPLPGSYRWRGRVFSESKMIANTLASGLDDFPRSPLPSVYEYHLDLLCWMAKATAIMHRLSAFLKSAPENKSRSDKYDSIDYKALTSRLNQNIARLHWSDEYNAYLDVGYYNKESGIEDEVLARCERPSDGEGANIVLPAKLFTAGANTADISCTVEYPKFQYLIRGQDGNVMFRSRFVTGNLTVQPIPRRGYLSAFPLLLRLEDPASPRLGPLLDLLESPDLLWTPFGLRSIARNDTFYRRGNAPGDEPYWRGPIWININYLALGALYHYSQVEGPHRARAAHLYSSLRSNVQTMILSEFKRTGYFWEQYDDVSGQGIRGHPFTGWTALIVNIMAEIY